MCSDEPASYRQSERSRHSSFSEPSAEAPLHDAHGIDLDSRRARTTCLIARSPADGAARTSNLPSGSCRGTVWASQMVRSCQNCRTAVRTSLMDRPMRLVATAAGLGQPARLAGVCSMLELFFRPTAKRAEAETCVIMRPAKATDQTSEHLQQRVPGRCRFSSDGPLSSRTQPL